MLNDPLFVQDYAVFCTSEREASALEEHVLTGITLHWWCVRAMGEAAQLGVIPERGLGDSQGRHQEAIREGA
jgi:hypothetical protein